MNGQFSAGFSVDRDSSDTERPSAQAARFTAGSKANGTGAGNGTTGSSVVPKPLVVSPQPTIPSPSPPKKSPRKPRRRATGTTKPRSKSKSSTPTETRTRTLAPARKPQAVPQPLVLPTESPTEPSLPRITMRANRPVTESRREQNLWLSLREAGLAECFFAHAQGLWDRTSPQQKQSMLEAIARHDPRLVPDRWERLPIGLFVSHEAITDGLVEAGFSIQEIEDSRLIADRRLPSRLVGPIRDTRGRITSFWAWDPDGGQPRYLYWKGQRADRSNHDIPDLALGTVLDGRREIVLVEDLIEALLLQSYDLDNVGAIGGPARQMKRSRWERLAREGVQEVTLIQRVAKTEQANIVTAIDHALAARSPLALYVLPLERFGTQQDMVAMAKSSHVEAVRRLIEKERIPAFQYRALVLLAKHRPADGLWTHRHGRAALDEATEFYRLHQRPELDTQFAATIAKELGLERHDRSTRPPPRPLPSRPWRNERCEMHRCEPTGCFCFD